MLKLKDIKIWMYIEYISDDVYILGEINNVINNSATINNGTTIFYAETITTNKSSFQWTKIEYFKYDLRNIREVDDVEIELLF